MFVDMCADVCAGTCIDIRVDMCIDMCMDVNVDARAHVCACACVCVCVLYGIRRHGPCAFCLRLNPPTPFTHVSDSTIVLYGLIPSSLRMFALC